MFILDLQAAKMAQEAKHRFLVGRTKETECGNNECSSSPETSIRNLFEEPIDNFAKRIPINSQPELEKTFKRIGFNVDARKLSGVVSERSGCCLEDYDFSETTSTGKSRYYLRKTGSSEIESKVSLAEIRKTSEGESDNKKLLENMKRLLEIWEEQQGIARVNSAMSFANVIPKVILVILGALAGHISSAVRSLAGQNIPVVARIARTFALMLAKLGDPSYARELQGIANSLGQAVCDSKCDDETDSFNFRDGSVDSGQDSGFSGVSGDGGSQLGRVGVEIEKVELVDRAQIENGATEDEAVVDEFEFSPSDIEKEQCEEDCASALTVNDGIRAAVDEAENTQSEANDTVSEVAGKRVKRTDAQNELDQVIAAKSKAVAKNDQRSITELSNRESELQRNISFYA